MFSDKLIENAEIEHIVWTSTHENFVRICREAFKDEKMKAIADKVDKTFIRKLNQFPQDLTLIRFAKVMKKVNEELAKEGG